MSTHSNGESEVLVMQEQTGAIVAPVCGHLVEVAGVEPASEAVAGRRLQAYPRAWISGLDLPRGGMKRPQLSSVHRVRESAETR